MKFPTHIIVTVGALVIGSAGVLYPINTNIDELRNEIQVMEAQRNGDELVSAELRATQDRIAALEAEMESRTKELCPNTPAGRHAVETAVHERINRSGLRRISMDRQPSVMGPETPAFGISIIVEGDAFELHEFLVGVESLKWVTRVLSFNIQPGEEQRRITLQIAVLLEDASS
ncbi:MAG: hypothetical protein DHS20C15_24680 [Planctomycetota bacterium]|nr:MAG: hypothetical protein DHS20C15_24680 [Planctomycetota bacterium]